MTFNRDRDGKFLTYEDVAELIREESRVPFYSIYDFYLGHGVLGGKMISGSSQGCLAADLVIRVLSGEPAGKIPVLINAPNRYMFDMFELRRFDIPALGSAQGQHDNQPAFPEPGKACRQEPERPGPGRNQPEPGRAPGLRPEGHKPERIVADACKHLQCQA